MPEALGRASLPPALARPELRLLLLGGRGGVGKTSVAAATALALARARPRRRVVLVSVDPAHSLWDCLAPAKAEVVARPENLEILELDADAELTVFLERHGATIAEIARLGTFFDEDDIQRFLDLALPGLDELVALLRISEMTELPDDSLYVIDTAPAGHTLRLLSLPDALRGWLGALDTLLAKHRYLDALYRGHHERDAMDRFIDELLARCERLEETLRSPRACFVLVTVAESLCLRETVAFRDALEDRKIRLGPLVLNRVLPANGCPTCAAGRRAQRRALLERGELFAGRETWALPLFPAELAGERQLSALWTHARSFTAPEEPAPVTLEPSATPRALGRATTPGATVRLVLVAGKGGVGKTTIACALALRLAARARAVTLISTDPAPSLAACLDVPVGPEPARVAEHLTVQTIDAGGRWRAWRDEYQEELRASLERRAQGVDLTFDRAVLERLLDLSPPGVDEIMAVLCVLEQLDGARDGVAEAERVLVLDNAATGHLLRLLEMPELLTEWIRSIFAVLLKYKRLLRLPRLSDRLIALSKQLKRLRALLRDAARAQLIVVTLPTSMALAEAQDLLAACARMHVDVSQIIVNQQTPGRVDCALCSAIAAREQRVIARWRALALPCAGVTRGDPPVGLARVGELGERLFSTDVITDA